MNAWQDYKKKFGTTRPWDILKPSTRYVTEEVATQRFSICEKCPSLFKVTSQCKECGCFMKVKVTLEEAVCPLSKW